MGPLAQPPVGRRTPFRTLLLASLAVIGVIFALAVSACGGDDSATPATATASPTASANPSPAASSLGPTQFDSARALAQDKVLSLDIGSRPAGSDAELRAAEYIRDQLSSYGYDASLQSFKYSQVVDGGTTLAVVSPQPEPLDVTPFGLSANLAVEGEIVSAGQGRPEEFPTGVAVAGKIALIERGDLTFQEKVQNATAAGAAGTIIYNNAPGSFGASLPSESAIPTAGISQEQGQHLLSLLSAGAVTVHLDVKTRTADVESRNIVAKSPGGTCDAVIGGHYDSVPVGPGANDNGSGAATVIEMARTLAAQERTDGVCVTLFGAEELGLLGSAYYVSTLTDAEKSRIKGMLNFDMLGVGDAWPLVGSPQLVQVAGDVAQQMGLNYTRETSEPLNIGSDHASFINVGVPAVLFNCFCDEHYHSAQDQFHYVQESRLAQTGALGLGTLQKLLTQ